MRGLPRRAWTILAATGVVVAAVAVLARPPGPPTVTYGLQSTAKPTRPATATASVAIPSAAPTTATTPMPTAAPAAPAAPAPDVVVARPATPKTTPAAHPAPAAATFTTRIVAAAQLYLGVPYLWGGVTSAGMDCSGLVYTVLHTIGVFPPRTADAQMRWTVHITKAQARAGDLVFGVNADGSAHHVGIYIGNDQMIDAPNEGDTVGVHHLYPDSTRYGRIPT